MQPDAVLRLRLRTTAEGGRNGPVLVNPGMHYGCPLVIEGQYFDCRWLVEGRTLELGHEHDVPIKFLSFALVAPHLAIGKEIQMWEGGVFADGVITDICRTPDSHH
ncbi:hypothetical protein [Burkholderia aenigmatica]|uniref:hypothetical protein n=1 Tax=Burkholderia aenigmatica TaxID=2015348 RepID=UPI00264D5550|nr:hypothetical protein [Burkholderia aenigmatica]MDN7875966.1 hypothetical protein [Burkholderia aenigmatica]